jgi:thioredoxin-like negative regulator of GroEL
VTVIVHDIAPNNGTQLFQGLCYSNTIQDELADQASPGVDEALIEALAECYVAADSWETRRQILSIMADEMPVEAMDTISDKVHFHRAQASLLDPRERSTCATCYCAKDEVFY